MIKEIFLSTLLAYQVGNTTINKQEKNHAQTPQWPSNTKTIDDTLNKTTNYTPKPTRKATQQERQTVTTLLILGLENNIQENYSQALEWFTDAETLIDSLNIPINRNEKGIIYQEKGVAYENLHDNKNALKEYQKAYDAAPENLIHQHNLAYGLALNDTALFTALKLAENFVEQIPEMYQGHHTKGLILLKLGQKEEGIKEIKTAIKMCTEEKHKEMYLKTLYKAQNK